MIRLKIILTLTLLVTLGCKAQQCIVPLEDFWEKGGEFIEENDCYVKDINNILGKYVGIWKGDHGNKSYEFRITKATDDKLYSEFKIDILLIKYIIKDSTGNIIENTTLLPDDDEDGLVIWGMYPSLNRAYMLTYGGRYPQCGQSGTVFIYTSGDGEMSLSLVPDRQLIDSDECVGKDEQILPTTRFFLEKVESFTTPQITNFITAPSAEHSNISQADGTYKIGVGWNANKITDSSVHIKIINTDTQAVIDEADVANNGFFQFADKPYTVGNFKLTITATNAEDSLTFSTSH